jgi:RNA polymerase sigma-70 factor, ECF subfamily
MESVTEQRERIDRFRSVFDDERVFRQWYDAMLPKVFGYLFRRCAGDRALAEELTQQTFVEAVRDREGFDGHAQDGTWLIGIARHRLVDHYRAAAKGERRLLKLMQGGAGITHEPLSAWELRRDILETLQRLPALQRAVLVLHYLDGMPVAEIAEALGKSEASVESLMTRGRQRFRSLLRSMEIADD